MNNRALPNYPQYSPIGPISVLEDLEDHYLLGDYLLLLAHDVENHWKRYQTLLMRVRERQPNAFVILDNSAVELPEPYPPHKLAELATFVGADVLVLPDAISQPMKTVGYIYQASHDVNIQRLGREVDLMAVIQGHTISEVSEFIDAVKPLGFRWWGIPRVIENTWSGRKRVVELLVTELGEENISGIHLLGMSRYGGSDVAAVQSHPLVRGIDSANPLVMGHQGERLARSPWKHTTRGDYWSREGTNPVIRENVTIVRDAVRYGSNILSRTP